LRKQQFIEIGGEKSDVGEFRPQRLQEKKLIVNIAAENPYCRNPSSSFEVEFLIAFLESFRDAAQVIELALALGALEPIGGLRGSARFPAVRLNADHTRNLPPVLTAGRLSLLRGPTASALT